MKNVKKHLDKIFMQASTIQALAGDIKEGEGGTPDSGIIFDRASDIQSKVLEIKKILGYE